MDLVVLAGLLILESDANGCFMNSDLSHSAQGGGNVKYTLGTVLTIKVTFYLTRNHTHTHTRQHWDISVVVLHPLPPHIHTHTFFYWCLHEDPRPLHLI